MSKPFPLQSKGFHPFGELLDLNFVSCARGASVCRLEIQPRLLNPHRVLHGGVIYSMADTGMGGALYSLLDEGETCSTLEIKIVYFAAVSDGHLDCETKVIHQGGRFATLESEIALGELAVAKALGTFAIGRSDRG